MGGIILPCISTNCAGSNEVIKHEKNGLLVTIGSEEELSKAMKRIIQDPELAKRIRHNSLLSATVYDSKRVIKVWDDIINLI